jgi:hypothetical protein
MISGEVVMGGTYFVDGLLGVISGSNIADSLALKLGKSSHENVVFSP